VCNSKLNPILSHFCSLSMMLSKVLSHFGLPNVNYSVIHSFVLSFTLRLSSRLQSRWSKCKGTPRGTRGPYPLTETWCPQTDWRIIDSCVGELRERFSERNTAIVSSVRCLAWEKNKPQRRLSLSGTLCLLAELVQVDISSTSSASECAVAAQFIQNNFNEVQHKNLSDIMELLLPVKTALPMVYSLYAAALTLGISSASCEVSFSALPQYTLPSINDT